MDGENVYINQHTGKKINTLSCLLGSICWAYCINAAAEVVVDGSLGNSGMQTLAGQHYAITENLGQRQGNNVFHSFSHFNVLTGETAMFQVNSGTENILARVTGNEVSTINGVVSTGGSQANLWLINPQGWLLGSEARFDVNGAFHLTAANAVGFSDSAKFYANPAQASQLSMSAPLTLELDKPTQAAITIEKADLQFSPYQTISLTAPKLTLNQSALTVPGGQLLLGGLSSGVWTLDQQGLKGSTLVLGEITVNGHPVDAEGFSQPISTNQAQGIIYNGVNNKVIDGGRIQLLSGTINLYGAYIAQSAISGGRGGDIELQARTINLENETEVSSNVVAKGDAGNITLLGDRLLMSNSSISAIANAGTEGNAGVINVDLSQQLTMGDRAAIAAKNNSSGAGGAINVKVDLLSMNHGFLSVLSNDVGNAGTVAILANTVRLESGGTIDSSTLFTGNGGNINIHTQRLSLTDPQTFITSKAYGTGHGGLVDIHSDQLNLLNQAEIRTSSEGTGDAGKIQLTVNDEFWLDHAKVTTEAKQSNGGPIELTAGTAFLRHGQITTSVEGPSGNGGDIKVAAHNLVMDGGFIQANTAAQDASGGEITVNADYLFAGGNQIMVDGLERRRFDEKTRDNVIQAAAPNGRKGNVELNTVELNIAGQLLPLDSRFAMQRSINDDPCRVTRSQKLSSLVAVGYGSLPTTAEEPIVTSLQHYLTPAAITSLAPDNASSSSLVCPEQPL